MSSEGGRKMLPCIRWSAEGNGKVGRLLVLALCAYIVFVPSFSLVSSLGPFNEKRVLQIGLLLLICGGIIASEKLRRDWISGFFSIPRSGRWGLYSVLGLGLFSAALAPAQFYAFLEIGHFVALFAAAGVIASFVRRTSYSRTEYAFFGAVVISALLYVVPFSVAYGMYLTMEDIKLWPWGWSNFANVRFFNHYQTWTLPLLIGAPLAIPERYRGLRGLMFATAVFWWSLVFGAEAQGTMVALGVSALATALLFGRQAEKWLLIQGGSVLLGWGLYKILFASSAGGGAGGSSPFGEQLSGESQYGRLTHWRICLELLWENPLLGVGPMHFAWPPYQFTEPASPHSALMQWLAEWGAPSTGIMGGLTVWGGWTWIRSEISSLKDARGTAVSVALVASILAAAAHSLISGIILHPLSQILLVFVGGWAWGRYQRTQEISQVDGSACAHVVMSVILLAVMVVVGAGLKDLATIEERREAYRESTERRYYAPRYWQQGYIGLRDSTVRRQVKRE